MSQTWENGKKTNFGPGFDPFWPKVGPQKIFRAFYLYKMLYTVASYHCMQYQEKLKNQTWKNGKKPSFGPDFDHFGTYLGPNFFFSWILPLLDVRN